MRRSADRRTPVSVLRRFTEAGAGVALDQPAGDSVAAACGALLADSQAYTQASLRARELARSYSLEAWSEAIRHRLTALWGPLRTEPPPGKTR